MHRFLSGGGKVYTIGYPFRRRYQAPLWLHQAPGMEEKVRRF